MHIPTPEKYIRIENDSIYLLGIAALVGLDESGGKVTICETEYRIKFRSGDYLKIEPIGTDFYSDGRALWMHMCKKRHNLLPELLTYVSPDISSESSADESYCI
jgi:hypothetical protein